MAQRRGYVFISYGREDGVKEFAARLYQDLKAADLSPWLDTKNIEVGADWPQEIGSALNSCSALLAIMTKKYVSSIYCKKELYYAVNNKKKVYPLIYDDVSTWKDHESSQGVAYMIEGINWTFFRPGKDDYSASIRALIGSLDGDLQGVDLTEHPTVASGSCSKLNLDSRPKLNELKRLKGADGDIKIMEEIAPIWKDLAMILEVDFTGNVIATIERDCRKAEECVTEVMKKWFNGKGRQPPTWKSFIEVLEDCDYNYLANEIRKLCR